MDPVLTVSLNIKGNAFQGSTDEDDISTMTQA